MAEPKLLTVPQVAAEFQVTAQTIRNWIDHGTLPAVRIGRAFRVKRQDVEALLERASADSTSLATRRDLWQPTTTSQPAVSRGRGHIRCAAYRPLSMSPTFIASLEEGAAVLRFPFDERLRLLLRAIPGRRWDAEYRVWRVPLDPDRAEAITRLFATVPYTVEVSGALGRALERRRAKRRPDECVLGLARADDSWWFSFATDNAADLVAALLQPGGLLGNHAQALAAMRAAGVTLIE